MPNATTNSHDAAADAVSGIRSATERLAEVAHRLDAATLDVDAAQGALARLGELEVTLTRLGLRPRTGGGLKRRTRRAPPHKKI